MSSYQDLAVDLIAGTSALRMRINGSSMAPLIQDGEFIILHPTGLEALRLGEIIAYRHARDTITHRIISIGPQGILTLGDNLRKPDPPIAPHTLIGRVVALEQNGEHKSISDGAWPFIHTMLARLGGQMILPRPKWVSIFFRLLFWLARKSARGYLLL